MFFPSVTSLPQLREVKVLPQNQMTLRRPAALKTSYKVGNDVYKLCAGRLIDPRIVPPYFFGD